MSHDEVETGDYCHPYAAPRGWCRDVADPLLNRIGPPHRASLSHQGTGWIATRYADVRMILSDRRFKREPAIQLDPLRVTTVASSRVMLLANTDPPWHTRLRRLFSASLTATEVRRHLPRVRQLANVLLDDLGRDNRSADLAGELYDPLAFTFVSEMFEIPFRDAEGLLELSNGHQATSMPAAEVARRTDLAGVYFDDLVTRRKQTAGEDVVSIALRQRDEQGDPISDYDVASMAMGLFATGAEALSGQLQISTQALLRHPAELSTLRDSPGLMSRAVDELLRFTPITIGPSRARFVTEDVEMSGVLLPAGSLIAPAASFDPDFFHDPYRLMLDPQDAPILSFGFGAHFCQAAQLARMVLATVLAELITRSPPLISPAPMRICAGIRDGGSALSWNYRCGGDTASRRRSRKGQA